MDPLIHNKLEELESRKRESELGGGKERIDRQKAEGKLTARERIAVLLFDKDTFEEVDQIVETPLHRLRYGAAESPGRWRGHRLWHH